MRWKNAELLHQTQIVPHGPMFYYLPLNEADHMHLWLDK